MKILVIKTSSMGDLVHCLPAVKDIAQHFPDSDIHWLAEESFADIARLASPVSQVVTCAMRRWRRGLFTKKAWREITALRHWIQQQQYDCIIDFQGLIKSAIWCRGLSVECHGYDWSSAREPLASLLYQQGHSVSTELHATERNRLLAAQSLGYELSNASDAPGASDQLIGAVQTQIERKKQVVFLHGTSRLSKELPVSSWQALTQLFHSAGFEVLVPWHSQQEHQQAQAIAGVVGQVLSKMSICDFVPTLASSMLVVAVDTGLAHLACALNTPTITLFFDSDPTLTGVIGDHCLNLTAAEMKPTAGQLLPNIEITDASDAEVIFQRASRLVQL